MSLVAASLILAYLVAATIMGVRAERRLVHRPRLPMQWGLDGRPTWTAPRRLALVIVPALSGSGLFVSAAMLGVRPDGANVPEAVMAGLLGLMAMVGLGVYAGFLWGAGRWDAAAGAPDLDDAPPRD